MASQQLLAFLPTRHSCRLESLQPVGTLLQFMTYAAAGHVCCREQSGVDCRSGRRTTIRSPISLIPNSGESTCPEALPRRYPTPSYPEAQEELGIAME